MSGIFNPSADTLGISNLGNTAGTSGVASGPNLELLFAGGNNITLSQSLSGSSATVSIIGPTIPAATNFSLNGTSSSVSLIAGTNIAFSTAASNITIYGSDQVNNFGISSITAGGATAGTTTPTTGPVLLAAGSNITLSSSAGGITVIGPSGGAAGTNTISASGTSIAGTALSLALAAGANISLQTATAAGSMTVSVSGIVQTSSVSLTALGNTTSSSGGTFSNLLQISGAGIISIGVGAGSMTISATTPSVTNFSTVSLTALGNTTSSSTGSFNNLLQFSGAGIASVGVGAGSVTISVPSPAASGVLYVSATSAAGGATAGTVTSAAIASTLSLIAGNNITLSQGSNAAITFSVPTPAASGILYVSATSAAGGATAGTVTSAAIGSTLSLVAGANMTLSQGSNAAITFSAGGGAAGTQTLSASGTSVTGTAVSLALAAGANITLATATAAGAMTVSIAGVAAAATSKISATQNIAIQEIGGLVASKNGTVTGTAGLGSSLFLQRIYIPQAMTLSENDLALGITFPATNQGAGTMSQSWALYAFSGGAGPGTSLLQTVMSQSATYAWATGTTTAGGNTSLSQFQGGWSVPQILPMTFATTSIAAGEYVAGNLLNFAQALSTWTIGIYGALASVTNSTTLSNVTTTGQTTFAALSGINTTTVSGLSNAGTSGYAVLSNAGTGALTVMSGAGLAAGSGVTGVSSYGPTIIPVSMATAGTWGTGAISLQGIASAVGKTSALGMSSAATFSNSAYNGTSSTTSGTLGGITIQLLSSNSNIVSKIGTVAGSIFTGSTAVAVTGFLTTPTSAAITAFSGAPTSIGAVSTVSGVTATGISSLALSTQSIVPQYLTVPNFIYVGTGPGTAALPSVFFAGIMSTGAIPGTITISTTALTYTGTPAGVQPYFALIGS